ncbi:MAG: glutathione S-transferase family protein [Pseudohongiella sp.]|nr:glutathione S-transferase family protein [Pseudohongiella sp.]
MAKLTFYTNPYSRGRIVRWMLEETGAAYDLEIMTFGGNIKSPAYLAINPMGKVPAIKHGDTVVTEVVAICAYLADQFPENKLAPALDSVLRGTYYRWLFFAAGPLEMAMTAEAYNWDINEKNVQSVGCGYISDTVNTLEMALKNGPYVCGEQFTAADLVLSSYIGWEISQKNLEARPVFVDYVSRCEARPAAIRAGQLDDALIK